MESIKHETMKLKIFLEVIRPVDIFFKELASDKKRTLKRSEKESVQAFLADVSEFDNYFKYQTYLMQVYFQDYSNNRICKQDFKDWKESLVDVKGCYYKCKANAEKLKDKAEIAEGEVYTEDELFERDGKVFPKTKYVLKNFEAYRGYNEFGKIEVQQEPTAPAEESENE